MSNNIWNNPLMWQSKKTGSNSQSGDFGYDFDFEDDEGTEDPIAAFKQSSSLVDSAAKGVAYSDATPQSGGIGSPLDKTKKTEGTDNFDQNYLMNMLFGDTPLSEIPSLETLLGQGVYGSVFYGENRAPQINNFNINIFNDDDETDTVMADRLGVTTADIFDKGVAAGLSPLDIVDNINVLRSALTLREATDSKLNARDLIELYQASLNSDMQAGQSILDKNNIILDDGVSLNDIMLLMQASNNDLFIFAYLN